MNNTALNIDYQAVRHLYSTHDQHYRFSHNRTVPLTFDDNRVAVWQR